MTDKAIEAAAVALWERDPDMNAPSHAIEKARDIVAAYLAQREADGFVMVPMEPSIKMVTAGFYEYVMRPSGTDGMQLLDYAYRAMIAARP